MARKRSPTNSIPMPPLSARQTDVIALVAQGLTVRQVATRLFITESTARTHVKNIQGTLQVRTLQGMAAWFLDRRRPGPRITITRNKEGAIDIQAIRADGLTRAWATYQNPDDFMPALRDLIATVL